MTSSNRFLTLLSLCAGKPHRGQSEFSSRRDSNADLWCFCYQSEKKPVEQTLDWPQFRDAMTIIWRRRNALNSQYGGCWWPNAYLVPRHLEPSWRNRTVAYLSSCIFFLSKLSRGISYFAEVATLPNARDFIFAFLWLHRCIVCNYCNAVYSRLVLFLLKRHRMSPVQVVTLYKPKTSCCFIKGTLYFGYA